MTNSKGETGGRAPCALRRASRTPPGSRRAIRHCLTSLVLAAVLAACGDGGTREDDSLRAVPEPGPASGAAAGAGTGTPGCPASPIESNGIGLVRLGAGVGALGACPTRDTTWSLEGMPERGRIVSIGDAQVLAVTGNDTTVSRVIVTDAKWRTAAGVGVGSTVAELERAYGDYCAFPAEIGGIVAIFPGFAGVSFVTDAMLPPSGSVESLTLPADARVTQVLVHGSTVRCVPSRRAE
jgi:hypothetical protein